MKQVSNRDSNSLIAFIGTASASDKWRMMVLELLVCRISDLTFDANLNIPSLQFIIDGDKNLQVPQMPTFLQTSFSVCNESIC